MHKLKSWLILSLLCSVTIDQHLTDVLNKEWFPKAALQLTSRSMVCSSTGLGAMMMQHSVSGILIPWNCCCVLQDRLTLGALITLDVHARDVVQQLVDANVTHTTDFEWASQLRYYWRDNVWVEMVQACIAYGYEYLGNTPR